MKMWMKGHHSGFGENHSPKLWFGSRWGVGFAGALIVVLGSCPDSLCLPAPLPQRDFEEQSAAKTEIPFELHNDNLIIVKATIGLIKNVSMILDTNRQQLA